MHRPAILYALASAALFGVTTPAAKILLGAIDPIVLAGLLYCGAGFGVALLRHIARGTLQGSDAPQVALSRKDVPWLAGAITAGGIAGPILLMFGLAQTDAATASLLLALEGTATALIAWFVFHENFDRRIALGMVCIVAGAIILAWSGKPTLQNVTGPIAIIGACVAWAIDNNLTRKVSLADPLQIVELKGLIAGPFNVVIGLWAGGLITLSPALLLAGITGFLGYGVSLALYVVALRHLGAARTGAYFSTAPFLGAVVSIFALGESLTLGLVIAGGLMAIGVWLHVTEYHEHEHIHEPVAHAHPHLHDEHHQHEHRPEDPSGEPHTHWHEHRPIEHVHPHVPDMHHVHRH
jgi:drug/metabolite transporter (DMT)-like permease